MGSTLSLGVFTPVFTVAHRVVDVVHVAYRKEEAQYRCRFRPKIYPIVNKNVTRKFDGLDKRHRTITYVSFSLIQGVRIIQNLAEMAQRARCADCEPMVYQR